MYNYATLESESLEEVAKRDVWVKAMEEEIRMIEKNETRELVEKPKEKETIELNGCTKPNITPMFLFKNMKQGWLPMGTLSYPVLTTIRHLLWLLA